ncbi:AraC family transcriptional regulator [Paenibacillus mucilaginosus 3016]|uniref:AraC family transcriptional regulator n=2 Tax=Paenibacillus mucilaginosus TaxID=61624 RepID=H6NLH1_9BACL|nr:AraC family transcriptional regulator [Paenibacillus mucilaginosus]AFC30353.1 AraC family transcriptional regulator [Paenibacillus mucilaginosus 3016]WFA18986.1 AraC family transcriptional regulator [Paenibacillus mucilaginosus]
MDQEAMISAATTVYYLTDLNTYLWDEAAGLQLSFERIPLPEFLKAPQAAEFSAMRSAARLHPEEACVYTNELGMSYAAALWEGEGRLFAAGPFLTQTPELSKLAAVSKIDQNKRIVLEAFFRGLKLMGHSKIRSIARIVGGIRELPPITLHYSDVRQAQADPGGPKGFSLREVLNQPDPGNADLIELRYTMEKEMMHAVELGDAARLKEAMRKSRDLFDFSERYPGRPLRAVKNGLIVLHTILRISAERGKVPPFFLHQLSEKIAIEIERLESLEMHQKLVERMCLEYCSLVRQHTLAGCSSLVRKAAGYLEVHLGQPFDLQGLARYCLVHPAHLSRQFKKETGCTLTDYLNGLRIREAKVLLRGDRSAIEEIASRVGFEDPAYFARVFKKQEGVTPSQYRNSVDG